MHTSILRNISLGGNKRTFKLWYQHKTIIIFQTIVVGTKGTHQERRVWSAHNGCAVPSAGFRDNNSFDLEADCGQGRAYRSQFRRKWSRFLELFINNWTLQKWQLRKICEGAQNTATLHFLFCPVGIYSEIKKGKVDHFRQKLVR